MPDLEFTITQSEARRILAMTGSAPSQPEVSAVVGPMFGAVVSAIERAGGRVGIGVATYAMGPDGGIDIVAGFEWDADPLPGLSVVDLPDVLVASATHYGVMATIGDSWSALMRWAAEQGFVPAGPGREIYHESSSADQTTWVTALQQPIARP